MKLKINYLLFRSDNPEDPNYADRGHKPGNKEIITIFCGYGYFLVKTVMLSPFSAKKWLHGRKATRKAASDFAPTERLMSNRKAAERLMNNVVLKATDNYLKYF